MKFLYCIFCFLLLTNYSAFGQKQANIWYFGFNAGLDFNTSPPTPLLQSAMLTNEGCTSVSDTNGQLLFYSDGQTVWNKNHQPMPNGTGLMSGSGLLGSSSATQAVLAVPQPGTTNIYYIFTVDEAENNYTHGLRYSVLDMTLNNGLGDLTTKNVLLQTPVTEKLTAIKHANNTDFWILAHEWDSDGFLAYLLTANGLTASPVISNSGTVHTFIPPFFHPGAGLGQMKANGAGTKLALALGYLNRFELFDFDKSTGVVFNPVTSADTFNDAYGIEFSPDGTKLYATIFSPYNLYQFDLNNPDVFGSGILIITSNAGNGALQLAPDGRIYTSSRNAYRLGVINRPDSLGLACDFRNQQVYLDGKRAGIGLPNYPNSFLHGPQVSNFTYRDNCFGYTTFFSIPGFRQNYTASWNFGDPASGSNNVSTDVSAFHQFSAPGSYQVTLTVQYQGVVQTIIQTVNISAPPTFSLGNDTVLCAGQSLFLGENAVPGRSYLWQDKTENSTFLVTKPGRYSVTISDGPCLVSSEINVFFEEEIKAGLGADTTICLGENIMLGANANPEYAYRWNNGSTSAEMLVSEPGVYTRTATKGNCSEDFSIRVDFRDCEIKIPNIITPNNDGLNDLFAIQGLHTTDFSLEVFNRWGNRIFQTNNYRNNWQAADISDGVYYYLLRHNQSGQTYKGWVEVVR